MNNLVKIGAVCISLLVLVGAGLAGCELSEKSRAATLNNEANDLQESGNYNGAITKYNEAIKLDSNVALYYANRGLAYYHQKQWDQAIEDYSQAIKLDQGNARTYYQRGAAYEQKKLYNQAIDDYKSAQAISTDDTLKQQAADRITYVQQNYQSDNWANTDIFPHDVVVDLDFPSLLLYADVNSQPVQAYSDTYDVEWYCNDVLISNEASLTEKPFIEAIGGKEGTYTISVVIKYKGTEELAGPAAQTTVTAKKDKAVVIIPNHWISAIPGIGLKTWNTTGDGTDWWGYDVDLKINGTTGTLTTTFMTASVTVPQEMRQGVGTVITTSLTDIKDDGTNIIFTYVTGANKQITITYTLTRMADGHLKGNYHLMDAGGESSGGEMGAVSIASEWIGTVDLVAGD